MEAPLGGFHEVRLHRGGEGVCPKADIVLEISKGGCVILRTRGEGVQKPEISADVLNGSSLTNTNVLETSFQYSTPPHCSHWHSEFLHLK